MEWNEFLTHPKVVHSGKSPGRYLFLKTLHEIVRPLNKYKGWVIVAVEYLTASSLLDQCQDVASQWNAAVEIWPLSCLKSMPDNVHDWVYRWNPFVDRWVSSLLLLQKRYTTEKVDDLAWPSLMDALAATPTEISQQHMEAQGLTLPGDGFVSAFVSGIIQCTAQVVHFCNCVRNREYLYLWQYYPDKKSS